MYQGLKYVTKKYESGVNFLKYSNNYKQTNKMDYMLFAGVIKSIF